MADLTPLGFVPENVEEMDFKLIPPGIYPVVIVDSDVTDTKKKDGKMLVIKYQVTEGQCVGDTLTDRLNIQNPSDIAQKIGLSQLKNICDAIGHTGQLMDSNQLHGKQLSVKVVIDKFKSNKDGKELESNKIDKRMEKQTLNIAPAAELSAAQTPNTFTEQPAGQTVQQPPSPPAQQSLGW